MTIQLSAEQEKFVNSQVSSGNFNSSDEVVTVAFRLLEKLQDEYTEWIEETRRKVDSAVAQMGRGEGVDGETCVQGFLENFARENSNSSLSKALLLPILDEEELSIFRRDKG